MIDPPNFLNQEIETYVDFEKALEQRVLGVRNARVYRIDETQEERNKRIETSNYALEDFCTGFLFGLRVLGTRKK